MGVPAPAGTMGGAPMGVPSPAGGIPGTMSAMGMRARGGRAGVSSAQGKELAVKGLTAGAETGPGRLQKMKMKVEDANAGD